MLQWRRRWREETSHNLSKPDYLDYVDFLQELIRVVNETQARDARDERRLYRFEPRRPAVSLSAKAT